MEWNMAQLGQVFDINKGIVHRICSKEIRDFAAHIDHPNLLDTEQEEEVIQYIITSLQLGYSISQKQIRVFVRQQFNKVPSRRWF
jgi:hypothetical protein